jgi:hypothetical protein
MGRRIRYQAYYKYVHTVRYCTYDTALSDNAL